MYTKIQVVFDAAEPVGQREGGAVGPGRRQHRLANDTARGNSIAMRDPEGNEFCVS